MKYLKMFDQELFDFLDNYFKNHIDSRYRMRLLKRNISNTVYFTTDMTNTTKNIILKFNLDEFNFKYLTEYYKLDVDRNIDFLLRRPLNEYKIILREKNINNMLDGG